MQDSKPRPPLSQIIIYAIGQYGWSLASFSAGSLLVYFYMPTEDGIERFPAFFYQGSILGILTIVGLLGAAGRLLDAFTDPWIAKISDSFNGNKLGKRKKMMAIAALPFALSSFLLFYPISHELSNLNVIWLVGISIVYYICFTMYLIPYNALIAELGHHPDDRMKISTVISLTWIFGFATGFSIYGLIGTFVEQGYSYLDAFQTLIFSFSCMALVCMLIPVFFLNENKYAQQNQVENPGGFKYFFSLILKNNNLKAFVFSDLTYWLSATFIQLGIAYYITLLMGKDQAESVAFLGLALICSLLFYWPINVAVRKVGKKKVTIMAFCSYIIIFGITGFIDLIPLNINILFYFTAILSAFPMASFGIIPNAIIADLIYRDSEQGGINNAGTYFAVRTFMMKIGITLANLIFPSLLLMGKSLDNPMGVRATAVAALIFCIVGVVIFSKYEDKI